MDDANEVWAPVPGYEMTYEVSDFGRVRSLPRPKTRGRVLKPGRTRFGYPYVNLVQDGIQRTFTVHKLVTLAFRGPRPAGLQVRHLDGDPGNPRLTNLVYGTPSENAHDQQRHGTDPRLRKAHCPQGHAYTADNTAFNTAGARCCRTCRRERGRVNTARESAALRERRLTEPPPPHWNTLKTHCLRGHEFTVENTYHPPGTPRRRCRECRADHDRRRQARLRSANPL